MQTYTSTEIAEIVGEENIDQVNGWLDRGDGIAVYENQDMGHPEQGRHRFASFGSNEAQFVVPPEQFPDFPGEINWRYRLVGLYRGKQIEPPSAHQYVDQLVAIERILSTFKDLGRLVSFNVKTTKFANGPTRLTVEIEATNHPTASPRRGIDELHGQSVISIGCWTDARGLVDTLGPFDWAIEGDVNMTGSDPNLGAAKVATYNNSLREN